MSEQIMAQPDPEASEVFIQKKISTVSILVDYAHRLGGCQGVPFDKVSIEGLGRGGFEEEGYLVGVIREWHLLKAAETKRARDAATDI